MIGRMKDILPEIPFDEYVRKNEIPRTSPHYKALESTYLAIERLKEFVASSNQLRPIGRETAQIYIERLKELKIADVDQNHLVGNLDDIHLFIDSSIEKTQDKAAMLSMEFESLLRRLDGK